jgi:hypothetical protein
MLHRHPAGWRARPALGAPWPRRLALARRPCGLAQLLGPLGSRRLLVLGPPFGFPLDLDERCGEPRFLPIQSTSATSPTVRGTLTGGIDP